MDWAFNEVGWIMGNRSPSQETQESEIKYGGQLLDARGELNE